MADPRHPVAAPPDLKRWAEVVHELPWTCPPSALWVDGPRQGRWFVDGRLNAATACVGVHAAARPDAVALIWEGEPGERRSITYAALVAEVAALARGLRGLGVVPGDRVALHLGLVPETVVGLLACAAVGAVAAVLPTPLPAEALADRLTSLAPRVLFTQDGAWRRGAVLPLKARADDALSAVDVVEHTIVVRRTGIDVGWFEGDHWYHDLVGQPRRHRPRPAHDRSAPAGSAPELVVPLEVADLPADHPLLVVPLPHRRGRPLSVVHGAAAVLTGALALHRGIAEGEVIWCAGDISWLGTQAHGIYGPLLAGATAVLFEGTLDVPTHARAWEVLERHTVTTMLATPSVLRMMRLWSLELARPADRGSLRRVVAFGEPVDPDLRAWAADGLAGEGVEVLDGWGQVELGGIVLVDRPALAERSVALPDVGGLILSPDGGPVADGAVGELVLTRPWAGTLVAATGPDEALDEAHWQRVAGCYTTGDLVRRRSDGSIEFHGRIDEVASVSGHLVSLGEVRAVLEAHPFVSAVDVFERRDQLGGRQIAAAVVLTAQAAVLGLEPVTRDLGLSVREVLGGLARPRQFLIVDRFGDELRGDERRRALAALPIAELVGPTRITWAQVLAAAQHTSR